LRSGRRRVDLSLPVNDLVSRETVAHLPRHGSTYGSWHERVEVSEDYLAIRDRPIRALKGPDLTEIDWDSVGVDVVIEATGSFRTRDQPRRVRRDGA
jgi:glyceraldehyde 3-phosphate dehydrogenase